MSSELWPTTSPRASSPSPQLGNRDDPDHNLSWGAAWGVKTFFARRGHWELLVAQQKPKREILERCIFQTPHQTRLRDRRRLSRPSDPAGDCLFSGCRCRRKSGDAPYPNFQAIVHDKSWWENRCAGPHRARGPDGFLAAGATEKPGPKPWCSDHPRRRQQLLCRNASLRNRGVSTAVDHRPDGARSVHLKGRARWLDPPRNRRANPPPAAEVYHNISTAASPPESCSSRVGERKRLLAMSK